MAHQDTTFFKVVIVGHIDHGKSTLIGRLLYDTGTIQPDKLETIRQACREAGQPFEFAYITDQIREERLQGITLDTTQIFFHSARRDYAIIDAPGHKEFLRNMITGASQADGAVLVIDALEGIQEQTRRHAYLLSFLGLRQPIVLINKMDLTGYQAQVYDAIHREMADFFASLEIAILPPIPIVAAHGDNIATASTQLSWYQGPTLLEALDALPKRPALTDGPFRMPIQDVYQIGDERIVVGQIESGRIAAGERAVWLPEGRAVTITSIREFGRERQQAECGENIGLTLNGADAIRRGQLLAAGAALPAVTREIQGTLCWLSDHPLQLGEPLMFRCTTQETACTVREIYRRMDSSSLTLCEEHAPCLYETEVGTVCLETEHPVMVEPFAEVPALGRFVLERAGHIVAGGVTAC